MSAEHNHYDERTRTPGECAACDERRADQIISHWISSRSRPWRSVRPPERRS